MDMRAKNIADIVFFDFGTHGIGGVTEDECLFPSPLAALPYRH